MNTLITIGIICLIGIALYFLPKVGDFIESFVNWNFGDKL